MKRIVIACDGTWKRMDSEQPTNVAKLVQAVLPAGPDAVAQVVCHLDGVGTGHGTLKLAREVDRLLGGAFGSGLTSALEAAYRFLVLNYAPGDAIYLFGYSRGAYTARSLTGLIRNCGILERGHAAAIPLALALYRDRRPETGRDSAAAMEFRARYGPHVATGAGEGAWRASQGAPEGTLLRIAYLGVWDTVGALGLPGHFRLAGYFNRGLAFHDTRLSGMVAAARHAVAIDERRRSFPPTLWDNLDALNAVSSATTYRQAWFPGDHGAVGGGGPGSLLSNDALLWVAEGAVAAGLALDPKAMAGWAATRDCLAPLSSQSDSRLLDELLALGSCDRDGPSRLEDLADAAATRWRRDPVYRPGALARVARLLGAAGESPQDRTAPDPPPR